MTRFRDRLALFCLALAPSLAHAGAGLPDLVAVIPQPIVVGRGFTVDPGDIAEGCAKQITGNTVGMLKILFHRETLEILGIHCFGDQAAEIVHIGQAVMSQKGEANSVRYFVNTT